MKLYSRIRIAFWVIKLLPKLGNCASKYDKKSKKWNQPQLTRSYKILSDIYLQCEQNVRKNIITASLTIWSLHYITTLFLISASITMYVILWLLETCFKTFDMQWTTYKRTSIFFMGSSIWNKKCLGKTRSHLTYINIYSFIHLTSWTSKVSFSRKKKQTKNNNSIIKNGPCDKKLTKW